MFTQEIEPILKVTLDYILIIINERRHFIKGKEEKKNYYSFGSGVLGQAYMCIYLFVFIFLIMHTYL